MKRILIIGKAGSGKSTFANKLGKRLGREVTHLDSVHYNSGWKIAHTNRDEWKQKVRDIVARDEWIIDGHYSSTIKLRIPRADVVICFDLSKIKCLWRIWKRSMDRTQPFDKPEGNLNKLSWDLIKKVIFFDKKKILDILDEYKEGKKIYIVKNDKESDELLEKLSNC